MRPNPKRALHQERPPKSDTIHAPAPVPPPPSSWVSGSAALCGLLVTFGVVSLLRDEHPLRATLLRSPLSQMCTVGLFWWGAALLWLRRRQALAEHESLRQLSALLTPEALTSLVRDKLTGAAQRYDALSHGYMPGCDCMSAQRECAHATFPLQSSLTGRLLGEALLILSASHRT